MRQRLITDATYVKVTTMRQSVKLPFIEWAILLLLSAFVIVFVLFAMYGLHALVVETGRAIFGGT